MSDLNALAVVGATVGAWAVYKISQFGRREEYLPPGPPTIPLLGNLHLFPKVSLHLKLTEWAQQYGEIYSLKVGSGTMVVLTSHHAIRELMDKNSALTSDRPPFHMVDVAMDGHNIALSRYNDEWRKIRRAAHDILTPQASRKHLPIQQAEAAQLTYDLLTHPEDFFNSIRRFSSSVGLSVLFGKRAPRFSTPEVASFYHVQHMWEKTLSPGENPPIDLIPILQKVPERFAKWKTECKTVRTLQRALYFGLLDEVEKRIARGDSNGCFVETLCIRAKELDLDRVTLAYLGGVLFDAGSDTTSGVMQTLVLALVAHPEVQKKAQAEIDRVVPSDRAPTPEDIAHLPYLRAIISEVHRFRPVAPMAIPHATTGDLMYKGYKIPAGTTLLQNTWGIFHDEQVYEDESAFDPDRYLRNPLGVREDLFDDPKDWKEDLAFGSGRRFCPGIHIAKNALEVVAANFLWGFNFGKSKDPVTGLEVEPDLWDYAPGIGVAPNPFKCTITPRSARHAELIEQSFKDATSAFEPYEQELSEEDREFVLEQRKGH